jgi:hypothetical protein
VALLGGGGFAGSNLAHRARAHGGLAATVVDPDDAKLRSRFENEPCCFVRCDVKRDPALVDETVAGHDAVVQLVARVQPRRFLAAQAAWRLPRCPPRQRPVNIGTDAGSFGLRKPVEAPRRSGTQSGLATAGGAGAASRAPVGPQRRWYL